MPQAEELALLELAKRRAMLEDPDLLSALDNLAFALRFDPPAGKTWEHRLTLDDAMAINRFFATQGADL